jgi:hypothetical protein
MDAETAQHQAKVSTVIAFMAMLYLPITTIAVRLRLPVRLLNQHSSALLDHLFHASFGICEQLARHSVSRSRR